MSRLMRTLLKIPRMFLMLFVFNTKWDAFLTVVPGILLLITGVRGSKDVNEAYFLMILGYTGNTWIGAIPKVALMTGCIAIFLGIFRFAVITLATRKSMLFYICGQSALIFVYLLMVIFSFYSHGQISDSLESSMTQQIANVHGGVAGRLSQADSLSEAWDHVQMKFSCCGIDSYRDYTSLSASKHLQDQVPHSCCVVKKGELVRPENLAQCQQDARMNVRDSVFIHSQGCYDIVDSWFYRYVHVPQSVFVGASFAQGLVVGQAVWLYRMSDARAMPGHATSPHKYTL